MARKGSGMDANVKKLFRCISKGDFITAYELLKGGLTPEVADTSGFTAAGWAVFHSKSAIVKIMLERGLDPNLTRGGISLLHLAASNGKTLMAKMLLRAGANTATQDMQGRTPADLAKDDETRRILTTPVNELPAETEFDEGEQVFCTDSKGARRPAEVIKRLPGNRFRVQFLGFSATEVEHDALAKVTSAEVERQLEFMQQAKEAKRQQQLQQRARARAARTPRASAAIAPSEPVTPTVSGGPFTSGFAPVDSDSVRSSRRGSTAAARGANAKRRVGTDLITPPPAQRGPKAAKAGMAAADKESILSQLESVASSIAAIKDSVTSMPAPLPTFTSTAAAVAAAPADASTAQLVAENQRLQETVEVLRAQQRESTEALASSPAMTSSFAGKDEADKIKVIAELRTKCIQLEAERDRYKRLMELNAAKYATQQAEAVAAAAAAAAAREREQQQQQQQQQQKGGDERQEGDKTEEEQEEQETEKEAGPVDGEKEKSDKPAGEAAQPGEEDEGAPGSASSPTKQEGEATAEGDAHNNGQQQNEEESSEGANKDEPQQQHAEARGRVDGVKQEEEASTTTATADTGASSGGAAAMDTAADDDDADAAAKEKEEASAASATTDAAAKPDGEQKEAGETTPSTVAAATATAAAAQGAKDTAQPAADAGAHPNPEPLTAPSTTTTATAATTDAPSSSSALTQ